MDLKPRFTLEVYTAGLLVLSTLLTVLVGLLEPRLLWVLIPLLAVLVLVLFFLAGRLRRGLARALQCESFENSQVQLSLGATALPVALLSGKTLVWYNSAFRQRILADEDRLLAPVGKVLCGLDLHQCSEPAARCWSTRAANTIFLRRSPPGARHSRCCIWWTRPTCASGRRNTTPPARPI